ncbi:MAG: hypothetical protein ABIL09_04545, partial [Gemmatimonadota bacterium]
SQVNPAYTAWINGNRRGAPPPMYVKGTAATVAPGTLFSVGGQLYDANMNVVNAQGQTLQQNWQSQFDAAKAANEKRYQDILSGMEGMGKQEAADIKARWGGAEATGMQGLASKGLTGTTIMPTMRASYARNEIADQGRLQDRLKQMKFGFMERRTDAYPDLNQLMQLYQGWGAGTGGAGYSSSMQVGQPLYGYAR